MRQPLQFALDGLALRQVYPISSAIERQIATPAYLPMLDAFGRTSVGGRLRETLGSQTVAVRGQPFPTFGDPTRRENLYCTLMWSAETSSLSRGSMIGMDVLEAIRTRRSIGKLAGDVSETDMLALVEAGLWAPNHKLTKPWRFIAVRGAARERLGHVWAGVVAQSTTLEGDEREAFIAREARKPLRAPLLLVVSVRTDPDPVVAIEDFAAASAAVQNMLLVAHDRGYGAIWRTGAMVYRSEINEFLGLDADDRIVAIVYVGRPAMEPPRAMPRDVAGVLRIIE